MSSGNLKSAKRRPTGRRSFSDTSILYTANNFPAGGFNPRVGLQALDSWYRTAFEIEFRQPLLRGRGAFIQRMPIVISRISTDQEIANLDAQLQNMVTNVEIRYWELTVPTVSLKPPKRVAMPLWKPGESSKIDTTKGPTSIFNRSLRPASNTTSSMPR